MSDLLATLLSSLGEGAKTLGSGMSEKAQADNQERMKTKRQLLKDTQDWESERAFLMGTRPELVPLYDKTTTQQGVHRPLGDGRLGKLEEMHMANEAKRQLDSMQGSPEQFVGQGLRARGEESLLGIPPTMKSEERPYAVEKEMFERARLEAEGGMKQDNPPATNRAGMSDAGMGSSLATAVDIYLKNKMQAEDSRVALQAKSANELARLTAPTKTKIDIADEEAKIGAGVKKAPKDLSDQEQLDLKKEWRGIVRQTNLYNAKLRANRGVWETLPPEIKQMREEIAALTGRGGAPGDSLPMITFDEYVRMTDPNAGGEDELDAIIRERHL